MTRMKSITVTFVDEDSPDDEAEEAFYVVPDHVQPWQLGLGEDVPWLCEASDEETAKRIAELRNRAGMN